MISDWCENVLLHSSFWGHVNQKKVTLVCITLCNKNAQIAYERYVNRVAPCVFKDFNWHLRYFVEITIAQNHSSNKSERQSKWDRTGYQSIYSIILRGSKLCQSFTNPQVISSLIYLLISFEIMLNFAENSRFNFTECLFYCITHPSPLVSRHLSYFESWVSVKVLLSIVVFLYLGP